MTDEIIIEKYRPEYLESIAALRDYYRPDSIIPGVVLYGWELKDDTIDSPEVMVARHGERIVAMELAAVKEVKVDGKTILGAEIQDSYTHPDYHRRGLFSKLTNAIVDNLKERGVEFIYGIPNDNNYPIFIKRLSWDHPFDVDIVAKPVKLEKLLKHVIKDNEIVKWMTPLSTLVKHIVDGVLYLGKEKGITLERVEAFPEEINLVLSRSVNHGKGVSLKKSKDYLDWRYCKSPRKYENYVIKKDGVVTGYCVLHIVPGESLTKCYLVDYLSDYSPKTVKGVFHSLNAVFSEHDVDVVITWVNKGNDLKRVFRRLLFITSKKKKKFITHTGMNDAKVIRQLNDNASWRFIIGDSDNI